MSNNQKSNIQIPNDENKNSQNYKKDMLERLIISAGCLAVMLLIYFIAT